MYTKMYRRLSFLQSIYQQTTQHKRQGKAHENSDNSPTKIKPKEKAQIMSQSKITWDSTSQILREKKKKRKK